MRLLSIVRHFSISIMVAILSVAGATGPARAQEVIKIVVPFAAGGPVDAVARLLANEMQSTLGATIVVENRPARAVSSPPKRLRGRLRTARRC